MAAVAAINHRELGAAIGERRRMDRRLVLEEGFIGEMLEVWVLHPPRDHRFVEAMAIGR